MEKENNQQENVEEVNEREMLNVSESEVASDEAQQKENNSKVNFDFRRSVDETKSILKDAILRPHAVVKSERSISIETSGLILLLLSLIIGICGFIFYKFGFDGLLNMFTDIGFVFFITGTFSWIITFAIGYFSLYFLLMYFGNTKLSHKELLTKYAVVNIPFAIVFSLVILFFGFLLVDLFVITYVFALMLYGVIHVYLFMVLAKQPKFDLYWIIAGYLLFLTVVSYLLTGIDFSSF